jgi:hypothetical protein
MRIVNIKLQTETFLLPQKYYRAFEKMLKDELGVTPSVISRMRSAGKTALTAFVPDALFLSVFLSSGAFLKGKTPYSHSIFCGSEIAISWEQKPVKYLNLRIRKDASVYVSQIGVFL